MKLPKPIQRLIESFERLPGIGPKTAQRLAFYLLHVPQEQLNSFADSLKELKKKTKMCSLCFNMSEADPCPICSDPRRNKEKICVVEQALDIMAIERAGFYKGLYHVLHGAINPLDNIGPDELHLYDLLPRLRRGEVKEIIIATNPTMEGEATAMHITRAVGKIKGIKITRIGRGLPTGADLEYADEVTLTKAFEGRKEY